MTTGDLEARSWPVAAWRDLAANDPEAHRLLTSLYEAVDGAVTGAAGPVDLVDVRSELHFIGEALDNTLGYLGPRSVAFGALYEWDGFGE